MLGISDPWVWMTYLICLIALLFCGIYGYINWNKDSDDDDGQH
jgi:hypothetical protein